MRVNRVIAGVAAASLAVVTTACGSSTGTSSSGSSTSASAPASSSASSSGKQYVIGYSNPQGTQPVLNAFGQALAAAAGRDGSKVISLNAGLSVSKQVSDIQQFITDKVNAIVVFPLAAQALVPALTQAHNAGIKIIGYNALTAEPASGASIAPYDTDLDQGIINAGSTDAANYVAQQLGGKGNVVGVNISAPVPSLDAFIAAEKAKVTAKGLTWLTTTFDQTDDISGAESSVAAAATRYAGKINAVMAYFDGAAIGAAVALKAAGASHVVIVGQQGNTDGINAVKSGQISGTIDEEPYKQGVIAWGMIKALFAGQTLPPIVYPPVKFITKSNVSQWVPWTQGQSEVVNGTLKPPTSFTDLSSF